MEELNQLLCNFYNDNDLVCIFMKPAPSGGRSERFVKVAELKTEKWQSFLRYANAHGSNIYLSVNAFSNQNRSEKNVLSPSKFLLDFDTQESFDAFKNDSLSKNLKHVVIQSSPGKHQAIIEFDGADVEIHRIKATAETMARIYGADHTHDLSRVFRLPGFRNHKYSDKPMAKLADIKEGGLRNIYYLPCNENILKKHAPALARATRTVSIPVSSLRRRNREIILLNDYSKYLAMAVIRGDDGLPDFSKADFYYATYLTGQGYDESTVMTMIKHGRQRAEHEMNIPASARMEIKHKNIERYLQKTVESASRHQQRKFRPPVAQDRPAERHDAVEKHVSGMPKMRIR